MKIKFILLSMMVSMVSVFAALPPQVQYKKDKLAINIFLSEHHNVQEAVTDIDYDRHIVYFGEDCKLYFKPKF